MNLTDKLRIIQQDESDLDLNSSLKQDGFAQFSKIQESDPEKHGFSFQIQNCLALKQLKASKRQMRKKLSLNIPRSKFSFSLKKQKPQQQTEASISKSQGFQQNQHISNTEKYFEKGERGLECLSQFQQTLSIPEKQNFQDKFKILNKLGQGAHSLVYKCKEIQTNQLFAVKICKNIDQEMKQLLIRQYKLLKILTHQQVLKVFELFFNEEECTIYVVCELCQYQNLREQIKRKKLKNQFFSQKQSLQLIKKILQTIQYLQSSGICHRDIKPQNILYNSQTKEIKLIDFDISKQIHNKKDKLKMWTNTGSLQYRAPQTFSLGYDQKIDIWSTGIVLFQLLAGEVPFNSVYEQQTIKKIINQKIDQNKLKSCSPKTKVLLNKMLEKSSQLRLSCKEALNFFVLQKTHHKDDLFLEQMRIKQKREKLKLMYKKFYEDEDQSTSLYISYRVKMSYLDWKIKINK